ncbi:MAG: molybdopterin-dependent oxidoreductase [Planctomycetes bacterium]|nr:molybdopterin-dependent oxidoreductase [Planctomycetota bacterium]
MSAQDIGRSPSPPPPDAGSGPGAGPTASRPVSRRGFLKGAGAIAAVPLLAPQVKIERKPAGAGVRRVGPGPVACVLRVNGRAHEVRIEPRTTLLDALREQLDLTGAKEICGRGACGGCTVLLDGQPVNACMLLAIDTVGARITTVEGLAAGEQLSPVQKAFCEHDALQCGYCTPGLVVSATALLARNPHPSTAQIKDACAGHICRCGTYPKVFEAVHSAAGEAVPSGNVADNRGKAIECEHGRVDAALKVTGKAKFTTDVKLPGMAYATIVYCPYGQARLRSFNEEAARKVAGVLDVSVRKKEEYVYCGQETGYICAETRAALDDALAALDLKWTVLEPTTDPVAEHERSLGPIPPPLADAPGTRGDLGSEERRQQAQQVLDEAHRRVERTYTTQIQTHSCTEPHAALADYRGDSAELWCSTQGTGRAHAQAAGFFGLDQSKVRVHCEHVGGGFGSKLVGADFEGRVAVELSKKLGRPVRVVNTRKREHLDTGCRPGSIQYMNIATDHAGHPLGGHIHVAGVNGPEKSGGDAANPARYQLGSIFKSFVELGLTTGGARPFRAPGHPQGTFALDSFIDELAEAAGVDPLEYRKRIETSEIRKRMYDVGGRAIGWSQRPQPDGSGTGQVRRGIGMATGDWSTWEADAQIRVDVFRDGTVRVLSGTQDLGTGTRTVLVDVCAAQLGIERKLITSDCGNSDYPPGPTSGGSMTVHSIVPAIRDAADRAAAQLHQQSQADFSDTASWIAACKRLPNESFTVVGEKNPKYWGQGGPEAVQFAEVEVDTETGLVRVVKVVALQNCGQAINRLTAESQIIGGVIQGVSFALFEEKILDPTRGCMLNPNLEQYKILGPRDCPEIVPIIWHEGENLGARSLGEPPTIPTAGALANAVSNALGARVRSLPITPARVLAALAERGGVQ